MNFTHIRRLIQYLLLLYVLALTDLWSTFSIWIWKKDQPQFVLDDRTIEKSNLFSHFKFAKPVIAAVVKSPNKIRKMIFPQGVPIFADNSDENNPENAQNEEEELDFLDNLFADVVGPMTSDWAARPRDETTLPRILLAMRSINKNEADYALNEMVKIVEKLDMDTHSDLMAKSFEAFIKISQDKSQTDQRYANILNHLPFLYSCSSSSDEYAQYGEQMLDYLLECLQGRDQYRRTAIYAVNALLDRDSISTADIKQKVVPALFNLLQSATTAEEHRNELATALCRLAQSRLDPDWIFFNFLQKYSLLLRDEHLHVKKAAIAIFGYLAREFGERFTEEFIVPHIVALLNDSSWSVRKSVSEIYVEVSRHCPASIRKNVLAPRFIYLLRDRSKWVIYQAFQELGPFIATFADSSITGLNINEKGQVVSDGTLRNSKKIQYYYNNLPDEVYLPEHNRYPPFSQEEADNVLGEMTNMLDNWDNTEFRNAISSDEEFTNPPSIAAKCGSVEDLTSLCYNDDDVDHDKSFFGSDDDENMEDFERDSEKLNDKSKIENNDGCQITYWNASADIVDISDDLIAFGTVCITSSMSKLAISCEDTQATSSSKSDTVVTFRSGQSSDTDSFRSEPDDLDDGHPLPDCRGFDEDDDKMDTTDAELSDLVESQLHNHVPRELIDNFLSMVVPSSTAQEPDTNRFCAHNFPAVAYTLGRESWTLLRDTYKRLANEEDLRVRVSIASSLHEIGRIIGVERTDSDLLPIFIQYKDDNAEVRYNILKNIYEFFQCLSNEKRDAMMSVLPEIMPVSASSNVRNDWRYRHEFVKQCRKLCNLYGDQEINKTMSAIALTMANDRIAEVRTEAVLLIVEIIRRFSIAETPNDSNEISDENMPLTSKLLKDVISSFAKTQKWSRRLTFTHICQGILEQNALSPQQFRHYLLAQLFGMTSDKVANVRLGSCRVLALLDHYLSPLPIGGETTPTVKEMLKKISNDNDIDVAREARLSLKEISDDKTDINLRGRKIKIKEEAFFKDGNINSYEIKDMSVDSQAHEFQDNYDVVDMDISSENDSNGDEPNTSEC